MIRRPPVDKRTGPLCPYTTLFRSRLLLPEDAFALAVPAAQQALAPLVERLGQRLAPPEAMQAGGTDSLADWMWRFRHVQARAIMETQGPWIAQTQPSLGTEATDGFAWAETTTATTAPATRDTRANSP